MVAVTRDSPGQSRYLRAEDVIDVGSEWKLPGWLSMIRDALERLLDLLRLAP
jgi:hypothetical protein